MAVLQQHVLYSAIVSDLQKHLGYSPSPDPDPLMSLDEFRAAALLKSIFKKNVDAIDSKADFRALQKFASSNDACESWEPTWWFCEDELIGSLKYELWRFFEVPYLTTPSFQSVLDNGAVGPGSSVLSRGTDPYTKMFDGPLVHTNPKLLTHFKSWVHESTRHSFAEIYRDSIYGSIHVDGSKLAYVPKTRDISRTICSEPVVNMYFQLGYGRFIERRLKSFYGIDLADQQVYNRHLARVGSLPFGPGFATLDLESASDRSSLKMFRYFLPKEVMERLELYSSRRTRLPDSSFLELHMLSSMGNGFTFPLMTALFSAVVSVAYRAIGLKPISRGSDVNFAVFGDDIIVVPEALRYVNLLLKRLGHVVNTEKSFERGPFRESCGSDWFSGQNVRGIYSKTLTTQSSRCILANHLNQWSSVSGILLPRTIGLLLESFRRIYVPLWEVPDAGYRVPSSLLKPLGVTPLIQPGLCGSFVYKRMVPTPTGLRFGLSEVRSPRGSKKRQLNIEGAYLCALKGYIRGHFIPVRSDKVYYRPKKGIAPNWDFFDPFEGVVSGVPLNLLSEVVRLPIERAISLNTLGRCFDI